MNKENKDLFLNYIKNNVAPLLVDFIASDNIPDSIVLKSNCSTEELNGHYENTNFCPPEWFKELENNKKILVIDNIDLIHKNEQKKFIEILKYRQVSTFELPKNTIIILTAKNINKNTIDEEIYSLVAHIGG